MIQFASYARDEKLPNLQWECFKSKASFLVNANADLFPSSVLYESRIITRDDCHVILIDQRDDFGQMASHNAYNQQNYNEFYCDTSSC